MAAKERNHPPSRARRLTAALLVACLLAAGLASSPLPASAQTGVTWRGEYYANTVLSGTPALVRTDSAIDFAWGPDAPASGLPADAFSVRWTSYAPFTAGSYAFVLTADDGARLWVDEQLIVDQWRDQSPITYTVTRNMSAGYHSVRLEFYERAGDATCKLSWSTGTTITDWRGEYYDNPSLTGSPILVRNDASVSYEWGTASPASGLPADQFSARWTRAAYFASSGTYTFSATADDGVRVWVDDTLLIDQWVAQTRTTHTAARYLAAGNHDVKVEYYEGTGTAVCILAWRLGESSESAPAAIEVVVDDQDSGFTSGGGAANLYPRSVGHGGHLFWTWNSDSQLYNWAKWFPTLTASGNWEVYAWIPGRYSNSRNAIYTIYHNGTSDARAIDQSAHGDEWVSLDTYFFGGGASEYVTLGDDTGEEYATRFVGFDAIRFVLRSGGGPSRTPSECSITPGLGFGRVWTGNATVRGSLGCASEGEKQTWAGEQSFQNGYVFWRQDEDKIYVLYGNGTWSVANDTWSAPEPEEDPAIVPPSGYYQPKRGIGKVWREVPAVRSGLGWAATDERGFHGAAQRFERGTMFWSDTRGILVLYADNTWQRYP